MRSVKAVICDTPGIETRMSNLPLREEPPKIVITHAILKGGSYIDPPFRNNLDSN
jgi:hypothetical protein